MSRRLRSLTLLIIVALSRSTPAQQASPVNPSLFAEMRWRSIGPHRGGRTRSAAGHPARPFTFYAGVTNGGVWKTTDAGRTWFSIFDDQPTNSVGSVVVAPSNPDIIYVGSGEGLQRPDLSVGDGVFRSNDAGKTWTHLGLRDGQQIPNIAVDPKNPDRIFVAVLGHPYGPSRERGVFRSTDGGRTFQPVLQKDENIGANDVDIDPSDPNIVYATLWEGRQGPWENAAWGGTGDTLFKSTDGGTTWRALKNGLPPSTGQINLAIAPSNSKRIYAAVASANTAGAAANAVGIYRSDDAGETWTVITTDTRPAGRIGGGDLPVPIVNPRNPDMLVMASTVSWKSVDGGKTWAPFKGAPGGEDYQGGWMNPDNPDIMLLVADQGAVVTLNGGESWSAWYNQPTAQLYHVSADNAFPYRVCSGQQESGSVCVSSRGNYGAISLRDYLPVGVDEYGYVAPDPLNPDLVYGGRSVTRFDRRTGQVSTVGPAGGRGGGAATAGLTFRQVRTQPVVFSEADKKALYFGNNYLWKTIDGGITWQRISDDLTRKTYELPKSIGRYADPSQVTQRGVIYTIGPSPRYPNRLWIGTDDGLIHTTDDGGLHWTDVTPQQIGPWWKVFMIDAGHFDALTAYAAVNTLRLDDMRPHLYRTHDGGKTWTEIVTGLDGAGPANAIREDPKKPGLLYASTERAVYVSFDDGDHWQSLRLNMPASSVRDIIVKDDDLVAATHGRGFWILDDLTPLRQISPASASEPAILFKPTTAWRVRWNTSTDMPWPKEEPTGQNPPDGAFINYYLGAAASGPVVLEIVQADGKLVRRYSSTDPVSAIPEAAAAPVPLYWYRKPQALSTAPGMHRFMWDVHLQPLGGGGGGGRGGGGGGGLPIQAIPGNSAALPSTPWANPGTYTVKLTVNGKTYTQPITVKQDPRVKTPALVMQAIYADTKAAYYGAMDAQEAARQAQGLRDQIAAITPKPTGAVADAIAALDKKLSTAVPVPSPAGGAGGSAGATANLTIPVAGGGRGAAGAGAQGAGGGRGAGPGRGGAAPVAPPTGLPGSLTAAGNGLSGVMSSFQGADVQPTANQAAAMAAAKKAAADAMARWNTIKTIDLPALNLKLKAAGLSTLRIQ